MANKLEDRGFQKRIQRIETLIQQMEEVQDPRVRAQTKEIIQAILDLHETGLERILDHLSTSSETGQAVIESLATDDLIGSLLLLYGLHPLGLEVRVQQALEMARPALRLHGGNVELLSVTDGTVRIRLEGNCHGCPSSAVTLKTTIEDAIYEKAPDVSAIEVESTTAEEVPVEIGRMRVALTLVHC